MMHTLVFLTRDCSLYIPLRERPLYSIGSTYNIDYAMEGTYEVNSIVQGNQNAG